VKLPQIQVSLSPRVRKIVSYSGYPLFYLGCLFVFSYWTFPYDRLKERVLAEFEASQAGSGAADRLEIGSLGPYWFSGLRARNVRLTTPSSTDPTKPVRIEAEEVHVRVSILPLLIGRVSVAFGADAFGGHLSGAIATSGGGRKLELSVASIDVGSVGPLAVMLGAPLAGRMTGSVDLNLPEQKLTKASGNLEFKIEDMSFGDGKTPIQGKIALPRLNVGSLLFSAEAKDGVLKIAKMGASGQDLDFVGEGKVGLQEPWSNSMTDVFLRFRFSDAYRGRNDMTKSLLGAPGSTAPALFELADPRIKTSKRPDGYYGWHMVGLLKDARFDPAPGGAAAAGPGLPISRPPALKLP
jgi:type II secretion system protein N